MPFPLVALAHVLQPFPNQSVIACVLHPVLVQVQVRHRVRCRGLSFHSKQLIRGCWRPSYLPVTTLALTPALRNLTAQQRPCSSAKYICPRADLQGGLVRIHVRPLRRHLLLRANTDAVVASWPSKPRSPSRSHAQLRYAVYPCRLVNLSVLISHPARHSSSPIPRSMPVWTVVRDPSSPI